MSDAERKKAWNYFTQFYPFYANYQTSTTRLLPLVLLSAVKEINALSSDDATGIRQA
jgi:hypothetical protein